MGSEEKWMQNIHLNIQSVLPRGAVMDSVFMEEREGLD